MSDMTEIAVVKIVKDYSHQATAAANEADDFSQWEHYCNTLQAAASRFPVFQKRVELPSDSGYVTHSVWDFLWGNNTYSCSPEEAKSMFALVSEISWQTGLKVALHINAEARAGEFATWQSEVSRICWEDFGQYDALGFMCLPDQVVAFEVGHTPSEIAERIWKMLDD